MPHGAPAGEAAVPPAGEPATEKRVPLLVAYDPRACGTAVVTEFGSAWRCRPALADSPLLEAMVGSTPSSPGGPLFVDIETAGLAAAPLFLIGALTLETSGPALVQYVARDYAEEAAALAAFGESLPEQARWITYNGASFDVPYLRDRCAFHGVSAPTVSDHLDLLPAARRQWRGMVPNYRLQTLERVVCGRERLGDVPGEAISGLYHDFVRTGAWDVFAPVLWHNAMDLITLAALWIRLVAGRASYPVSASAGPSAAGVVARSPDFRDT